MANKILHQLEKKVENLNEIIGIAQVLPNIPEFTKNMTGTVKLIFSGAKSKK